MKKAIKDLTANEIEALCDARNPVKRGNAACAECPLRWGKQCMFCFPPIVSKMLYCRMLTAIGGGEVEVK